MTEMRKYSKKSCLKVETKRTRKPWKYQAGGGEKSLNPPKGRSQKSVIPSQFTTKEGSTTPRPSAVASYALWSTIESVMKKI